MAQFFTRTRFLYRLTSRGSLSGLTLIAMSAVVILEASRMPFGSTSQMGPGYFPTALGVILAVFGLVLLVEGWRTPEARVTSGPLGPPALLLTAIVAFAVLYEIVGGFIAIIVVTLIAAMAEPERKMVEWVLLPLAICFGIWLIFGLALDLQFKFLPPGLMR
ncbi:tripartite tricarboxylate transporter TctB family protein [Sulfitobacter sp. G21635-S1]|uniref:tripartite tricarboxylate transporter TctB family protein n=1 Tax=Sulfitobacter sp. G21635-S1 TaxID=3014043 RepID=UPI0022AF4E0D|nr:tripartite tricarboxylate transporter TctB family protein [Sulfitobacter sp. G21635-S1]MCZ4253935.1 tripartite tricarboxylate transporter TctB family protein [Sulfitobacter sp. G21635-S1]